MTRPTSFTCPACGGFGVGKYVHQPQCSRYEAPVATAPIAFAKPVDVAVTVAAVDMAVADKLPGYPDDEKEAEKWKQASQFKITLKNMESGARYLEGGQGEIGKQVLNKVTESFKGLGLNVDFK